MSSKYGKWMGAGIVIAAAAAFLTPGVAKAATPPLSNPRIVAHFDLALHQNAENLTVLRDGDVDVAFSLAAEVGQVDRHGAVRILAKPPVPADGGVHTPLTGAPIVTGITHSQNEAVYFAYDAGSAAYTGIWRLRADGSVVRVGAFPATAGLNGLALDEQNGTFYVADSALNLIWSVPEHGGVATVWASGGQLAKAGPNGIKVHDGAVWVTDTTSGTVVRIPIERDGSAGPIETKATFPASTLDDFAFIGQSDSMLIALDAPNEIVLLRPDGTKTVVLTGADEIDSPSAVAVAGNKVYVSSGAYFTGSDPNLLEATLSCH